MHLVPALAKWESSTSREPKQALRHCESMNSFLSCRLLMVVLLDFSLLIHRRGIGLSN
jgi:hypothetical protein